VSKRRLATSDLEPVPRFAFFGGKGGVGKTTCAAALAVARAELGSRVLVISIDPAHSLGDVAGRRLAAAPRALPAIHGSLKAVELDADRALERWLSTRRGTFEEILRRGTFLDDEDVARVMRLALPGIDELVGLLEIERLAQRGDYTDVIVDMAPTGHALRLLQMPHKQRQLAQVFDDLQLKHRVMAAHLARAYRTDACDHLIIELDEAGERWERILGDRSRAAFYWITLPEPMAVAETRDALVRLHRERIPVAELIVNRVTPAPDRPCEACTQRRSAERAVIMTLTPARVRAPIRLLPALDREPCGAVSLRRFGRLLTGQRRPRHGSAPRKATKSATPTNAVGSLPLEVPAGRRLLVFAGKGGVGKTTCAAAVATTVAMRTTSRRLQLLSVDPAHSLADVFGIRVGDKGRVVPLPRGTLRLRELDAERAFRQRQDRYRRAIDDLWGQKSTVEIADQHLVRRLVDLTPPGVDEVFAILAIVEALSVRTANPASGRRHRSERARARRPACDLVVLDTAPTGHTIRLLETIERTRGWVQALLSIFLKYREVVRLDEIAADLVEVSRSLGRFGDLLKDPVRTEFVVVSRAAAVVREETDRLLRALGRAGVSVSTVVVNGLTGGTCRRCARRMIVEKDEIAWLRRGLRGGRLRPAIVTTPAVLPPPCGADQLARWARQWTVVQ